MLIHTTLAVADASLHDRQIASFSCDEDFYLPSGLRHTVSTDDQRVVENGEPIIIADDLMDLAVVLGVTLADLLAFITIERPDDTPLSMTLPADVDQPKLRA